MNLPFEWTVLDLKTAEQLVDFIEKATAIEGLPRNYQRMQEMGILKTYNEIREFVEAANHYKNNLLYFRPYDD